MESVNYRQVRIIFFGKSLHDEGNSGEPSSRKSRIAWVYTERGIL